MMQEALRVAPPSAFYRLGLIFGHAVALMRDSPSGFEGERRDGTNTDSRAGGNDCIGPDGRVRPGAGRRRGLGGGIGRAGIRTCRRRCRCPGRLCGGTFHRSLVGSQAIGTASAEIAGPANHAAGDQVASPHAGRARIERVYASGRNESSAPGSASGASEGRPQRHAARSDVGMTRQG